MGAGTNLPGKIGRKLTPDILSHLVSQLKREIVVVTGTNGKTTSAGLIASIFSAAGRKLVHNSKGANMLTGITTSVIEKSTLNANLHSENGIFEIDEAYLNPAFNEFNPDIVLVTNLFRDQLDRYGELNTTAKKIETAIEKTSVKKPLKLILNADDPLVSGIAENYNAKGLEKIFYGFEKIEFSRPKEEKLNSPSENSHSPQETVNCKCGNVFKYSRFFYGHLGYYECVCGAKRTQPQVTAVASVHAEFSNILITTPSGEKLQINIALPGLYNCYNALAAVTTALEANISPESIKKGIEKYSTSFGRAEVLNIKGKEVIIQLIKNPIGATEVLRTIKNNDNGRLFIIINDNYADGRDVSWLWDANFELLSHYNKTAVISGTRASDMAVRLKYAGVDSRNIIVTENIKKGLLNALSQVEDNEKLFILPTYTALLELEKLKTSL